MKREKVYPTDLIPVKSYKKGLVFLAVKTVNNITNHLLKLAKAFFMIAIASVYSNASQYSGAIKACRKFAFT